jgi:hypothetical protein
MSLFEILLGVAEAAGRGDNIEESLVKGVESDAGVIRDCTCADGVSERVVSDKGCGAFLWACNVCGGRGYTKLCGEKVCRTVCARAVMLRATGVTVASVAYDMVKDNKKGKKGGKNG